MTEPRTRDDVQQTGHPPWWPVFVVGALAVAAAASPPAGQAARPSALPAASTAHHRVTASSTDSPSASWMDIGRHVVSGVSEDRLLAVAAGVTFYALLAIFPAIAALVSLYGLVANPADIAKQLDSLQGILPGGAIDIVGEQVKRLVASPSGSLSLALVVSLAVSLWSANAGMKAIFDALNVASHEKEERGFIALNLRSLAFTFGALLILILALASVVVVPVVLSFIDLGGVATTALALARWPILLAIVVGAFCMLYHFGPSRPAARWRWIAWSSGLAAVLWVAASILFSFYVGRFGSYNATYGSLGSAIGFMTWLWISSIIVLIGAETCAAMEHRSRQGEEEG